jgi:hypothetical protein
MAIQQTTLSQQLVSAMQGSNINGTNISDLCRGIAQGIVSFLPSITVTTTHTGLAGAGVGNGSVTTLSKGQGIPLYISQMQGVNIQGVKSPDLAKGWATGISREITTNGQIQVNIAGTGPGTGTGTLTGMNPQTLKNLTVAGLQSQSISGVKIPDLAGAFAKATVSWFSTAVVQTVDTGSTTVPPVQSAGQGTGRIF